MTVNSETELMLLYIFDGSIHAQHDGKPGLLFLAELLCPVNSAYDVGGSMELCSNCMCQKFSPLPATILLQELKRTATLVVDQAYSSSCNFGYPQISGFKHWSPPPKLQIPANLEYLSDQLLSRLRLQPQIVNLKAITCPSPF